MNAPRKTRRLLVPAGLTINEVLVEDDTAAPGFEHVTFNFSPTKTRIDEMAGQKYLVAPMVMITEGVHSGSNGPLYYPAAELAKTPQVWNHKPIVVYHPTAAGGAAISACDPTVVSKSRVGFIMNTKYERGNKQEPGKLKAEAWIEVNRVGVVDKRVADALTKKKVMEVSTGLFTDNEAETGEWKGEAYTSIARNYRPDHLAVLPDEVGACSVADGAGLMRNQQQSFDEIRSAVQSAVKAKAGQRLPSGIKANDGYCDSPWIRDVFDKFCVYSANGKLYKHDYKLNEDGTVELNGSPSEVTSRQTYKTVSDGKVLNSKGAAMPRSKKQLVSALINNDSTQWEPDDREFLMGLEAEQLEKFSPVANDEAEPTANTGGDTVTTHKDKGGDNINHGGQMQTAAEKAKDELDSDDTDKPGTKKKGKMATNQQAAPTMDQYLAAMPPQMQSMVRNSLRVMEAQKEKLIEVITSNAANTFEEDYLQTKDVEELTAIARLAANGSTANQQQDGGGQRRFKEMNYAGAGDAFNMPVANAQPEENVTPLAIPTLNFSKRKAAAAAAERN